MDIFKQLQGDVGELTDICKEIGQRKSARYSSEWSQRYTKGTIIDLSARNSHRWSQEDPLESVNNVASDSRESTLNRDLKSPPPLTTQPSRSKAEEVPVPPKHSPPPLPPSGGHSSFLSRVRSRGKVAKVAPILSEVVLPSKDLKATSKASDTLPLSRPRVSSLRAATSELSILQNGGFKFGSLRIGKKREKEPIYLRKLDTATSTSCITTGASDSGKAISSPVDDAVQTDLKTSTSSHSGSDLSDDSSTGECSTDVHDLNLLMFPKS